MRVCLLFCLLFLTQFSHPLLSDSPWGGKKFVCQGERKTHYEKLISSHFTPVFLSFQSKYTSEFFLINIIQTVPVLLLFESSDKGLIDGDYMKIRLFPLNLIHVANFFFFHRK
uniref:Secreted protein n=1 Tax=Cacopsylla melanoneura TaxID=428564 RepID=A0A8D8QWC4_9HEMI